MAPYLRFCILSGNADLTRVYVRVATVPLVSRAVEGCQFYCIALSYPHIQRVAVPVVVNVSGDWENWENVVWLFPR